MKLGPHISVPKLRSQAKKRLERTQPEQKPFSPGEVELSTLNLLEEYVRSNPEQSVHPAAPSGKGDIASRYAQSLAESAASLAGLAGGHCLNPALSGVLGQIRWGQVSATQDSLSALSKSNLSSGPQHTMDWDVKITGHWTQQQLSNVQAAVEELARKTGTKALNLLRAVHLRTHLGDLKSGPVLGLTNTPGAIALRRDQSNHSGRTRWIVFHEVGHQVDRFLSGRSTQFRSHQANSPFGKSSDPADYVDPNQVGCPHEDFADCHARALYDYDEIQRNPDLYIHARGKVGEKMAWILEEAYKAPVAPPSSRYRSCLEAIDEGRSPFVDRKAFHKAANLFLDKPKALNAKQQAWLQRLLLAKTR